jgi:hypothetical protein
MFFLNRAAFNHIPREPLTSSAALGPFLHELQDIASSSLSRCLRQWEHYASVLDDVQNAHKAKGLSEGEDVGNIEVPLHPFFVCFNSYQGWSTCTAMARRFWEISWQVVKLILNINFGKFRSGCQNKLSGTEHTHYTMAFNVLPLFNMCTISVRSKQIVFKNAFLTTFSKNELWRVFFFKKNRPTPYLWN